MNLSQLQTMLNAKDYTLVAQIGERIYTSHSKGIAPVIEPLKEDMNFFKDADIVDKVVGKAAAMLFIKAHIHHLHTHVISQHAIDILDAYQVSYSYDKCVDFIVNRQGNGMCPMEETVLLINDLDEAFEALCQKQAELRGFSRHS